MVDVYSFGCGNDAERLLQSLGEELRPGISPLSDVTESTSESQYEGQSREMPALLAVMGRASTTTSAAIDDFVATCLAFGDRCLLVLLDGAETRDELSGLPQLRIVEQSWSTSVARLRAAFSEGVAEEDSATIPASWVKDQEVEFLAGTTLTRDAAALVARARQVSHTGKPQVDVDFSSLLLGFLIGADRESNWFKSFLDRSGATLAPAMELSSVSEEQLAGLGRRILTPADLQRIQHLSHSVRTLASRALDFAVSTSKGNSGTIDVRHLIGSVLYDGAGHTRDFENMKFDRDRWSRAFVNHLARAVPQELPVWRALHETTFASTPLRLFDTQRPLTRLATDRWTTEDRLGYEGYAKAIYSFLTHRDTVPPLTIGIQAPWGGGKTSLMRMIQRELDPGNPALIRLNSDSDDLSNFRSQPEVSPVAIKRLNPINRHVRSDPDRGAAPWRPTWGQEHSKRATVGDIRREMDSPVADQRALQIDNRYPTVWFNP